MRKFLLLFSLLLLALATKAQVQTLYFNDFESPSSVNNVYTDTLIISNTPTGTPPSWARVDTFGYNSTASFHVKGTPAGHIPYFITDTIDATATPYISFSFWHIAKIYLGNQGFLEYSIDGGQTFAQIPIDTTYQGDGLYYGTGPGQFTWFNESSYPTDWSYLNTHLPPLPSWWKKETFDLTNLLSDLSTGTGHSQIVLRFYVDFVNLPPGGYAPGWFVDDVLLEGATCELSKPQINFNFTPITGITGYPPGCFLPKPEGGQIELGSTNYPIAAQVTDNLKFYDTGVDTVMAIYQVNGGAFDTIPLTFTPSGSNNKGEYRGLIPGLSVGDSINWFVLAYDNACPNEARMPDITYNGIGMYSFFIEKGLPGKCGDPDCGNAPYVIRTFPWSENFDGSKWTAGTGTNLPGDIPIDEYWKRLPAAGLAWYVGTGTTPSNYTGPNGDHTTGGGNYMYLNSSGSGSIPAVLDVPCIDLTTQTGCVGFEFYYHMYGSETGNLAVLIDTTSNVANTGFTNNGKLLEINLEQQKSSTDPWRRAVFSLDDYVGKYVRIRFRGMDGPGGLNRGDIAIDDLRLFQPISLDAELIANPEPQNGYCDFTGKPIKVIVRNNGCTPLSSLPIKYKLSTSPTVYTETASFVNPIKLGDTATYTFTNLFPTIAVGNHQVIAWTDLAGDQNRDNDTTKGEILEYETPITSFPFIEDFENATVGTQVLGNSNWYFDNGLNPDFKWQVGEEMTTERQTGPYSGYHFKGKYLYAQSSGSASGGLSTYFRTLCIDLSTMGANHHATLDFYYHMFGADIDRLEVEVSLGDEPKDVWTSIETINNINQQNRELDNWKLRRVDLSSYSGSIKLRFKATRRGAGAKTNVAIDKIMIYNRAANDAGAYIIDNPPSSGAPIGPPPASSPTEVSIVNFGYNNLNTCTIHFRITPLCNPSAAATYDYYYNGGAIAPGTIKKVNIVSSGIIYPLGEFDAAVYVTAPNGSVDNLSFNDTISRHIFGGNNRINIPWSTNFDNCDYEADGFLPANSGLLQWERGKPSLASSGLIMDDRTGGGNAWVTNIDGPFLVGTTEFLRTPIYEEFDTVVNARLNFYMNLDFGAGNSNQSGTSYPVAATCKYLTRGTWEILGKNYIASNIGKNWYGGNNGAAAIDHFQKGPGWVGGSGDGTWIETEYPLADFNLDTTAVLGLRFDFVSSSGMSQSSASGGMGIDDFSIIIPPQNSVSPVKVTTVSPLPLPGFEQKLMISVQNTAEKVIDSFQVHVEIAGVSLGPIHWVQCGQLDKNQVYRWEYQYPWPAASVTSGPHDVCVYTSRPDNKPDNKAYDDTLCDNIQVMLELDFTESGQEEYCEDFESSTTFQWIHKDAKNLFDNDNCWAKGMPSKAGSAYSGTNAWSTHLDTNYTSMEQAALFTPVFEVDSGIQYKLEFYHWLQSEKHDDGGNVEYSFDGGITWYPIGYYRRGVDTWYNTQFVAALDQIRGGWTDTTGGWVNAVQRIVFQDYGKVILRFRFGADFEIQDKGWAIDDFCWTKDTSSNKPDVIIGEDEYQLPEEAIVGDMVPNPATDYSELSFLFPTPQDVEIRVYNLVGQLMESRSESFRDGVNKVTFNTVGWSAGIYFVNFEYGGKLVTRKLVVQ